MEQYIINWFLSSVSLIKESARFIQYDGVSGDAQLLRSVHTVNQDRCPLNLPVDFVDNVRLPHVGENPSKRKSFDWSDFLQECADGLPSDFSLKHYGEKWINKNVWLSFRDDSSKVRAFEGMRRGTSRYGKVYASKIQDWIQTVSGMGMETFALTLTYDVKTYGEYRPDAWRNYPKHVTKTLEPLRKKKGLQYCCVLESTKKGYPHCHIVMAFPKGTISGYSKMPNDKSIIYGWLARYLKSHTASRVFCCKVLKGNRIKYYMTKYIKKDTSNDLKQLCQKPGEMSDSERKALMELVFACSSHVRTVRMTRLGVANKVSGENTSDGVSSESGSSENENNWREEIRDAARRRDFARLRALLIKLCNNSPLRCGKSVYSVTQKQLSEDCQGFSDGKNISQEKIYEFSKAHGQQCSCNGCPFASLVAFVRDGRKNEWSEVTSVMHFSDDEDEQFVMSVLYGIFGVLQNNFKSKGDLEVWDSEKVIVSRVADKGLGQGEFKYLTPGQKERLIWLTGGKLYDEKLLSSIWARFTREGYFRVDTARKVWQV